MLLTPLVKLPLLCFGLLSLVEASTIDLSGLSVTFCNEPAYSLLLPCAGTCVGCYNVWGQIQYFIGCSPGYLPNDCYCRTDMFAIATSGLSSCVSESCTGAWQNDYTSAEAFYESYCRKNGFTGVKGPAVVVATVTTTQVATVVPPTVTQVTYVTQTVVGNGATLTTFTTVSITSTTTRIQVTTHVTSTISVGSNGSGNKRGDMPSSDRIALGIGLGLGIPTLLLGIFTCWKTFF